MHLAIFGGNGFIGRRVCRRAVADGHDVTSIARSGPPAPDQRGAWAEAVSWLAGDVFAPQEYRDALAGVDAVVHSIGIIDESPREGVTFERVNGDAAIVAALESERAGVDRFVLVSSAAQPPRVREAYLTAKRRAEAAIADLDLSTVVLRPGPVYGPAQPHFSGVVNRLLALIDTVGPVTERLGDGRPLDIETVGDAVYEATVRSSVDDGPLGPNQLAAKVQ